MKLPENYENWIDVAKECDKILQKYPDSEKIRFTYGNPESEFRIDAVKAKAFDEVMEKVNFTKDHAVEFRETMYQSGMSAIPSETVFDLLFTLAK